MISDTLRQKFLYSTPFSDDGFPLVVLDSEEEQNERIEAVSARSLYFWERKDFESFVLSRNGKIDKIVIVDDCGLKNDSRRLKDGLKCYLMSFAYQFKKAGFRRSIQP